MKNTILTICIITATTMLFTTCGDGAPNETSSPNETTTANKTSISDLEVSIGTQVWMKENLNVDHFRNGDPIPQANTAEEWAKAGENKQPACCYYENNAENGKTYGLLYNWYAVNDARGLAPAGYHIPTHAEWTTLTTYLGGEALAGTKMKSTSGWNENGNGTNSSGFNGLPGGFRSFNCTFNVIGEAGFWWSSTEDATLNAWSRTLYSDDGSVFSSLTNKGDGFYVRCLRD
jgi:uncharacterized protein (TIGR02145 family)